MPKEKIKIIIYGDHPNGYTAYGKLIKHIADSLHNDGRFSIVVLGIDYDDVAPTDYYEHMTQYPTYQLKPESGDPQAVGALFGFLTKCNFDILLTVNDIWHLWQLPGFLTQLRRKGRNFVWSCWFPVDQTIRKDWIPMINYCDYPLTMSKYGSMQLAKRNIEHAHCFIDKDNYKPLPRDDYDKYRKIFLSRYNLDKNGFVFGVVGKNQKRKNLFDLLKVWKRFHIKHPNTAMYYHTQHQGFGGNIKQFVKDNGIILHMKDPNRLTEPQMNKLYNNLDCLIVPSLSEGVCLPIIEAQLTGCPVIGANNTSITELLELGKGLLVNNSKIYKMLTIMVNGQPAETELPTFSDSAMFNAMESIYKDDKLRQIIGLNAYNAAQQYVANNKNWPEDLNKLWDMFSLNQKLQIDKKSKRDKWVQKIGKVSVESQITIETAERRTDLLMVCPTYDNNCGIGEYSKGLVGGLEKYSKNLNVYIHKDRDLENLSIVIRQQNPRVLHVQHEFSFFQNIEKFNNVLRLIAGKKIITLHTLWNNNNIYKETAKIIDTTIVHTRQWLDKVDGSIHIPMFCQNYNIDKEDTKKLRVMLGYNEDSLIIGSSGFIRHQKGYDNLVRAVRLLRQMGVPAKMLLIAAEHFSGWGYEDKFYTIVEDEQMENHVKVIRDYFPKRDMLRLLSCSDILVYAYQNQGMAGAGCSASIKDCLSLGKPIIVSDCSSFTDMGREVYRIESDMPSPSQIAKSIQWIRVNDRIKSGLAKRSLEKVKKDSLENIVKKHLELYGFN